MRYLAVDGMLSGTGVRDTVAGGYLDHDELGLSPALSERISRWLARYEDCHNEQFRDPEHVADLDAEGVELCCLLRIEIADAKIEYFSNAKMVVVPS